MLPQTRSIWRRDSQPNASGEPGAVQTVIGKVYDPPYKISTNVYDHIKENISTWIDDAIKARG